MEKSSCRGWYRPVSSTSRDQRKKEFLGEDRRLERSSVPLFQISMWSPTSSHGVGRYWRILGLHRTRRHMRSTRSGSTAANDVKSCSPSTTAAADIMRDRPADTDNAIHSAPEKAGRPLRDRCDNGTSWRAPTCAHGSRQQPRHFQHANRRRKNVVQSPHPFSRGNRRGGRKVATWASACTPASVRPEPWGSTFSPVKRPMAEASVPCTVFRPGCTCQPAKSAPSYERISLRFRTCFSDPTS